MTQHYEHEVALVTNYSIAENNELVETLAIKAVIDWNDIAEKYGEWAVEGIIPGIRADREMDAWERTFEMDFEGIDIGETIYDQIKAEHDREEREISNLMTDARDLAATIEIALPPLPINRRTRDPLKARTIVRNMSRDEMIRTLEAWGEVDLLGGASTLYSTFEIASVLRSFTTEVWMTGLFLRNPEVD